MRLLLIEDDRDIGAFIRSGLLEAGFVVDWVIEGGEGFNMGLSEPYDLAIIDLMLPDMDGMDLIERLRRMEITTPFLIRRAHGSAETTHLTHGDLSLDLIRREAHRGEERLDLQPREFALLEYLLRNRERVISRTMILEHIWGYHFDPQTNVVDVLVSRLRSKVDKDYSVKYIHTIRGVGYALQDPESGQ